MSRKLHASRRLYAWCTWMLALGAAPLHASDAGWVATNTKAFLPSAAPVATGDAPSAPTAMLRRASQAATAMDPSERKRIVVALKHVPAPTSAQRQAVVDYLRNSGFTDIAIGPGGYLVIATGSPAAIGQAFHTSLRQFGYRGRQVFANDAPAMVPKALGATVDAVLGLQNVAMAHPFVEVADATAARAAAQAADPNPRVPHSPLDFRYLYDADLLAEPTGGSLVMVAAGDLTKMLADLKAFSAHWGLPEIATEVIRTDDGPYLDHPEYDLAWSTASQVLVATAGGIGKLKLVIYNPSDLSDANILRAVSQITYANDGGMGPGPTAVVLLPFGMWEGDAADTGFLGNFDATVYNPHGNVPLYIAPSGDDGAYARTGGEILDAKGNWIVDPEDYSVNFPASSQYVDAVGGTALHSKAPSSKLYAWEAAWNGGVAPVDPSDPASNQRLRASGGGVSKYEAPFHTLPYKNTRVVPDISYDADTVSGVQIVRDGQAEPTVVGGTIVAAAIHTAFSPEMGVTGEGGSVMQYIPYYQGWQRQEVLRPVNTGNNGYGGYGYASAVSYDGATGWGSIDVLLMARAMRYWTFP